MDLNESSILYKNKEGIEHEISELNEMISEFNQVSCVLERLPNKVQHEIMVPLGPLAFSSGYIINTNKILMLLGTDLFAERTPRESLGTINRRRMQAKQCLETLEKNLNKIKESLKIKEEETYILNSKVKSDYNEGIENNIVFRDGFAEIREEINDNDEFVASPLPDLDLKNNQISLVSDLNVEKSSLNTNDILHETDTNNLTNDIESQISEIKISDNSFNCKNETKNSRFESKKNISLFKQRMLQKK
ncbi:prefoldin like molecular chaperone [Cryptosporidium ryanae]|uniref:prefoldin like molecular chaperone n=1 Tax=Cryptosporidium ryanae TaxID=515981 RepID=UPI00351A3925|nr:prefoldin like molecular chaperone [Cryptosporidium ryanae]